MIRPLVLLVIAAASSGRSALRDGAYVADMPIGEGFGGAVEGQGMYEERYVLRRSERPSISARSEAAVGENG